MGDGGQTVAIVSPFGRGCPLDQLRPRLFAAGLRADGAVVARLDRVVIEVLLRRHLRSSEIREDIVPRLLLRRVVLSWWRPVPTTVPGTLWVPTAEPEVLCAVAVPSVVRTWVMAALKERELP